MERECLQLVADPKRGKNMFVLGMLCAIYSLDVQTAREQIAFIFASKDERVIADNVRLMEAGHLWAAANLDIKFAIPPSKITEPQIVVNGNVALGLGVLASGMEVCAMYPITPATSASHYLSEVFEAVGGLVHQAEDEIAACAFAIGASYAGKCALTITSGPGFALKQETLGLAVMAEIPLVVVNVQRGGPSTGLPTKAEQGDLLFACFGGHGDTPKVVVAAATIEDCFYSMITARKIAETFNTVVVVLTDANLASAQQPFARPRVSADWLAAPVDQSAVPEGARPYDWDARTGLARRFIPGQPNGMHCLTGLAHDRMSRVAYDPDINQEGIRHRSLKLAAPAKNFLITHYPQPVWCGTKSEHPSFSKEFTMARNKIQFQKGLSERQFRASYGTEEQCRAALAAWRWPQGFRLPALRRPAMLRDQGAQALPVRLLPPSGFLDRRHHLPFHQAGPDRLVPGHLPGHPNQEGYL